MKLEKENEASPAGDEHFKMKSSRSGGAQSQLNSTARALVLLIARVLIPTARAKSADTSPTDR